MDKKRNQLVNLLRICCILLFLGRGWQHLFWDAPYRSFFWNENLLSGFIETFTSLSWNEYVTSPVVDGFINLLTKGIGIFYFFLSGVCYSLNPSTNKKWGRFLLLGSLSLFILSYLYFATKFYYIGMLIEHSIQVGIPVAFYLVLYQKKIVERHILFFKSLIALTFCGHGMFAVGFHPVPGPFLDMLISFFHVTEGTAREMLTIAGSIDFISAVLIFVPLFEIYALGFNVFWGIVTALARVVANIDQDLVSMTSHQWVMETVYRIPHGLFPLAILLYLLRKKKVSSLDVKA